MAGSRPVKIAFLAVEGKNLGANRLSFDCNDLGERFGGG